MPPFLPRKHLRSPSPEAGPSQAAPKKRAKASASTPTPRKPTLFDDLDSGTSKKRTHTEYKAVLDKLAATDDESSLSSLSSDDEFEDVPITKAQNKKGESDDEDEDIDFEDVETYTAPPAPPGPAPSGDLELTLTKDTRVSITNPLGSKKGPTKIERQIRVATHQMHVQLLMFHNAIRNAWICDKELQEILVKQLPSGIQKDIEKWRRKSGLVQKGEELPKGELKGKGKAKDKGKRKAVRGKAPDPRSQRDWGQPALRLESAEIDMSGGDPLFGLMKSLIYFWKQRFRITAPGLRKLGYMSLQKLDEETKSFEKDQHNPERHGERVRDIEEFKECARKMEGSRDVGAQLFTALLRGLGLETRLVANLQPVGFGWSQYEEASENNPRELKKPNKQQEGSSSSGDSDDSEASEQERHAAKRGKGKQKALTKPKATSMTTPRSHLKSVQSNLHGSKDAPIDLSGSEASSVESDEESVVDVTPARQSVKASLPYDKDLVVPSYWSEVLSPVTNQYLPVDAIVLRFYASNSDDYDKFLAPPKFEKVKHITSYIIGHSPDGTAKDVTTRYLKGKMWPGRTKGYRMLPEKVPIYGRNGKIKRYEIFTWFKTVMSGYIRGSKTCPRTELDDQEEATVLQPAKREKKVVEEGKESLQSYKSSSDFVLERHLKREQALPPGAKHVKMFTAKNKGEASTEEKVYLRKDVVNCKSMETWHKEGRAPIPGEEPLKRVPYRVATTNRRRELAEAEQANGGVKVLQGLFSWDQTDWIIPPPIENGIIPKNSFGNIDLYVDSMLPEGAAHLPWRGTVKICKRLGIDYAEAVTGFEFGHRMAVPVITGVVVAEEHEDAIREEWEKDEAERNRKEDEKRRKAATNMWRRMLMGMRIVERVKEDYGGEGGNDRDELNPFTNRKTTRDEDKAAEKQQRKMAQQEEDAAGGFFIEGHDEEEVDDSRPQTFFPALHHNDDEDSEAGGFIVEGRDEPFKSANQEYPTPQSLESYTKLVGRQDEDDGLGANEVEEMKDTSISESKVFVTTTKKRGRPSSTANKSSNSTAALTPPSKVKTTTKRVIAQRKTRPPIRSNKRKSQVDDSEDDGISPLSELESDNNAFEEEDNKEEERGESSKKAVKKTAAREASKARPEAPAEKLVTRRTPRRTAARKSATALKSHYFEHSDETDGD